jgi:hypothetical protein
MELEGRLNVIQVEAVISIKRLKYSLLARYKFMMVRGKGNPVVL